MSFLTPTHDIVVSAGANFKGACTDANNVYCVVGTGVGDFRIYNWSGFLQGTKALSATPSGIVLGSSSASCVIGYSAARISIVDSLFNLLDITTNALTLYDSQSGQQLAAAPASSIVISTTNTNSKVCKTDLIAQTVTQLTPTPLSTHQAACIILRPDTGTFLVGTNNGAVFEMNAAGTQIGSTLNMANIPNITAPTINVTGLSYYNGTLAVATNWGNVFVYTWPGQILLNSFIETGSISNGSNCPSLTDSASGLCLYLANETVPNSVYPISTIFTNVVSGNSAIIDTFYNETNVAARWGGIQPTVTGINHSKAWIIFNSNSFGGYVQLRYYDISNPNTCSEPTRFQNPIGVDVASRCIRIRDGGIGKTAVETDQNVSSGPQFVNAYLDQNYIELNLIAGKWDVREFST